MKFISFFFAAATMMFVSCGNNTAQASEATCCEDSTEATETEAAIDTTTDVVITLTNSADLPQATPEKPVVIDFNATWCGPCQQFGPIFHAVAARMANKATFVSVDTDVCPELAAKYGVQSIPYLLVIKADGTTDNTIGYMSEEDFTAFLNKNL